MEKVLEKVAETREARDKGEAGMGEALLAGTKLFTNHQLEQTLKLPFSLPEPHHQVHFPAGDDSLGGRLEPRPDSLLRTIHRVPGRSGGPTADTPLLQHRPRRLPRPRALQHLQFGATRRGKALYAGESSTK